MTELSQLCYTSRTVLVYRLGGTTLDVTVLAVNGGMYRVVATEHDTALGGIKFDELLSQHLAAEFQRYFDCTFVNFSWKIITERICINKNYPLLLRSHCSNTQLWSSWFCCRQCKQDVRGNARAMAKLMAGAEYCKQILSSRDTATCAIESLYDGIDMHSTVSRYCQWSTSESLLLSLST